MYCSKCGKEVNEKDKFCENCGTQIHPSKNNSSSNKNTSKKRKVITNIICVIVVVALIVGIQLIVNNANKSSMEYGKSVVEGNVSNNSTNKYKSTIKSKWNATLPSNNTNGLECAVYNIEQQALYLKYNYGICSVDKNNNINRYVNGDLMNGTIQVLINNAKNGNTGYVYMTATEFENIIK